MVVDLSKSTSDGNLGSDCRYDRDNVCSIGGGGEMIRIRSKFPSFAEIKRRVSLCGYSIGDPRRMIEIMNMVRDLRPLRWWQRIRWERKGKGGNFGK